jgi:hypothetical protein
MQTRQNSQQQVQYKYKCYRSTTTSPIDTKKLPMESLDDTDELIRVAYLPAPLLDGGVATGTRRAIVDRRERHGRREEKKNVNANQSSRKKSDKAKAELDTKPAAKKKKRTSLKLQERSEVTLRERVSAIEHCVGIAFNYDASTTTKARIHRLEVDLIDTTTAHTVLTILQQVERLEESVGL